MGCIGIVFCILIFWDFLLRWLYVVLLTMSSNFLGIGDVRGMGVDSGGMHVSFMDLFI